MAKLSDVLGSLLADLAAARHCADQETVRLAKLYREDPILRTMSVPRIRMPEVIVELPVLMSGPPTPKPSSPDRPPAGEPPSGKAAASDGFVQAAESALRKLADTPVETGPDANATRVLPALEVLFNAEDLRSRGGVDGAFVTRLRLKLREESVEWAQSGEEGVRGEPAMRLIPE